MLLRRGKIIKSLTIGSPLLSKTSANVSILRSFKIKPLYNDGNCQHIACGLGLTGRHELMLSMVNFNFHI